MIPALQWYKNNLEGQMSESNNKTTETESERSEHCKYTGFGKTLALA
jgi:hypothetical protein